LHRQVIQKPYLTLGPSSLGKDAGTGLFAAKDINVREGHPLVLSYFFGKLVLLTDGMLSDYSDDHPIFYGCRKNVIEFERKFNPIIYPTASTLQEDVNNLRLFLVASNCCIGSYANTAGDGECQADIVAAKFKHWKPSHGFQDLDEWLGIIRKPILRLQLNRRAKYKVSFQNIYFFMATIRMKANIYIHF
jgi:hypothetical protein